MKIFRIAFFLGILAFVSQTGFARLDEGYRENFPEILETLCASSVSYSVDDEVGLSFLSEIQTECQNGKCKEYHDTMQCVFSSAFSETIDQLGKTVKGASEVKSFDQIMNRYSFSFDEDSCQGKTVGEIQNKQRKNGFRSTCTESPHLQSIYSACRVAETALLEFCGYQKFLMSKMNDRISYKQEHPDYQGADVPLVVREAYYSELRKAESTLTQMLEYYRNFQQKYWLDIWLTALVEEIRPLQARLVRIWENIATFPDKFVGPSRDF